MNYGQLFVSWGEEHLREASLKAAALSLDC